MVKLKNSCYKMVEELKIPKTSDSSSFNMIKAEYVNIIDKKINRIWKTTGGAGPDTLVNNFYYIEPRNPNQNQFISKNMYWFRTDFSELKGNEYWNVDGYYKIGRAHV